MTWAIQDEHGNWLYSSLTLCAKYVKFCATRFIWSKIYIFNLLFYSVLTTGTTVNLSHRVQLNQNKQTKKNLPSFNKNWLHTKTKLSDSRLPHILTLPNAEERKSDILQ